jgi:hypothetical protein
MQSRKVSPAAVRLERGGGELFLAGVEGKKRFTEKE